MTASLLSLSLLAAFAPATIENVTSALDGDQMTVTIATSEPVKPDALSAKIENRRLHLYVDKGKTRLDRLRFETATGKAEVLARAQYAKVEIPLQQGADCKGPINLAAEGNGFRATITCHEAKAAIAPTKNMEALSASARDALEIALALPEETPAPVAAVAAVVEEPKVEKTVETEPAQKTEPSQKTELVQKAEPVTPASVSAATPAAGPSGSYMLPAMVLIGLGAAAFMFARRRGKRHGMITILESASLGPKRSLVVARINGNTMVLGTSEAGITLLQGLDKAPTADAPATVPAPASHTREFAVTPPPSVDEDIKIVEDDRASQPGRAGDETGWLTRLFQSRNGVKNTNGVETHKGFDALLHESFEDEDLRRKLARGLGGKVS